MSDETKTITLDSEHAAAYLEFQEATRQKAGTQAADQAAQQRLDAATRTLHAIALKVGQK